jgi:type IV pilus assembly protein PilX
MSNTNLYAFKPTSPRKQSGVALIISLILLTLMSLVGMASVRSISKEERMVAQTFDRSLTFQAAESALREAEGWIETAGRPEPAVNANCLLMGSGVQVMMCGSLATPTLPRWTDSAFSNSNWQNATPVGTSSLRITPQYFVEYLGGNFPCSLKNVAVSNCKRYRVTARAKVASDRAAVVLQSIYATYEP